MALVKNNTPADAGTTTAQPEPGKFEEMSSTVEGTEAGAPETTQVGDATNSANEALSDSTAVAVKPNQALVVAKAVIDRDTVLSGLQNAIPVDVIMSIGAGTFPRITCAPGNFMLDKTQVLGDELEMILQSWNYIWYISTKETNNTEADALFRTSYDGINLRDNEGTIADYVKWLKGEGYDQSSSRMYIELYGALTKASKKGSVPEGGLELVQISLSPKSAGQWSYFGLQAAMRKSQGKADGNVLSLTATAASNKKGDNYGLVKFAFKS